MMVCSITLNLRSIVRYPDVESIIAIEQRISNIVTSFMNGLILKLNSKSIEDERYIFWSAERVDVDKLILSFESNVTHRTVDDIRQLLTDGKEKAIEEACKITGFSYVENFDKAEMTIKQSV